MAELTLGEQAHLARLSLDRTRRSLLARMLRSPLMRWRYGAPIADEFVIIPQNLRTADPSFAAEIEQRHFGLAGRVAVLHAGSPFELTPPTLDWARELHGFSWLRHLRAAATPQSRATAHELVAHWIDRSGCGAEVAWEPPVVARRLISWIVDAALLFDGVDQATYDRTAESVATQLIHLSATWRDAPDGYPRLLALTALLYGDLCVGGHQHRLPDIERLFAAEVARQILPDGGHVSRNPGVLVELLLDLLPLRQCFASRDRAGPAALELAVSRMLPMLRFMRLGDSSLARFNGMGVSSHDAIATVIAYDDAALEDRISAESSCYVRLDRSGTIVLMDVGTPPPLPVAAQAHAGCLSFELSSGTHPIFVNAGAPGPADSEWRATSRSTAAHNTLCLDNTSSSRLVRHPLLQRMLGDAPLRQPDTVSVRLGQGDEGMLLEASHDGYLKAHGIVHRRKLALAGHGGKLAGHDRIGPPKGTLRLHRDLPFAVHFHLHPGVVWSLDKGGAAVSLSVRNGERWSFSATGAQLCIEESVHLADFGGPRMAHQIVLRGATYGESDVRWALERL